jgi:hypothetical protein
MTLRKRTLIALASLALAGGVVHWIAASTGCSVRNPNSCDYNERYELMRKHPELAGMRGGHGVQRRIV